MSKLAYQLNFAFVCRLLVLLTASLALVAPTSHAQGAKIWEFSPYEVQIWYQFEPTVPVPEQVQSRFRTELVNDLERAFKAAWRISVAPVPQHLSRDVSRSLSVLQARSLSQNEFSLVVSSSHQESKTVRTFQAAAESITSVKVSPATHAALVTAASKSSLPPDSPVAVLLAKLEIDPAGDESIQQSFKSESISAAFLPRAVSVGIEKTRAIVTPLPWQTDTVLAEKDKIFFVHYSMEGDQYVVSVRELDCPMLHVGPTFTSRAIGFSQVPRMTSFAIQRAFAPVARVESAEATSAELRHKAGGLIVDDNADGELNPARIRVGDVMQPIIRRDDKNGNPALLQVLNFTYCAVTDTDGVKMKANVYTYSGGPGLQGRQNRRTQRMVLRVRPAVESSDVKIVVRGNINKPQPGCFLYSRDFLTNEFSFIGRTDWRGRIPIPMPDEPVSVLPDTVRQKRAELLKEAKQQAAAKAQAQYDEAVKKAEEAGETPPKPPETAPIVEEIPIDPATTVRLNGPLVLLYVKSGDTVLAKLPYVPGLQEIDTAELLDDSLRLQSEAFVRGFQNEILDQIGLRNLLAARVKLLIKDGKLERAGEVVEELRTLKNFNELNDELGLIERSILEQSNSDVPRSARSQIDRMFKTTRDMLQKYLQEDVASTAADQLRKAGAKGNPSSEVKPADSPAANTATSN